MLPKRSNSSGAAEAGDNQMSVKNEHGLTPQREEFAEIVASGHSMTGVGIFDNDIPVVDRAVKPRHNHIVVAVVDGDFTVKQLYQRLGRIKLKAANPTFPDITPKDDQTIEVWGVVTASVKQFLI